MRPNWRLWAEWPTGVGIQSHFTNVVQSSPAQRYGPTAKTRVPCALVQEVLAIKTKLKKKQCGPCIFEVSIDQDWTAQSCRNTHSSNPWF